MTRFALALCWLAATARADVTTPGLDEPHIHFRTDDVEGGPGWRPIYRKGERVCAAFDTERTDENGRRALMRMGESVEVALDYAVGDLGVIYPTRCRRYRGSYEVLRGDGTYACVPAAALTPGCLSGDLDGDGRDGDLATIYFDEDGRVRVRARVGGVVQSVRLGDEAARGNATWRLISPAVAGVPLLEVTRYRFPLKGERGPLRIRRSYLSLKSRRAEVALEVSEHEDATSFSEVAASFDAGARTVTLRRRYAEKRTPTEDIYRPDIVETLHLDSRGVYR